MWNKDPTNHSADQCIKFFVKCSPIRDRDGIEPFMEDSLETWDREPHGLDLREEAERAGGGPSEHNTCLGGQWQGRVCRVRETKLDNWWLLCNWKSLMSNFLLQTTKDHPQDHPKWSLRAPYLSKGGPFRPIKISPVLRNDSKLFK